MHTQSVFTYNNSNLNNGVMSLCRRWKSFGRMLQSDAKVVEVSRLALIKDTPVFTRAAQKPSKIEQLAGASVSVRATITPPLEQDAAAGRAHADVQWLRRENKVLTREKKVLLEQRAELLEQVGKYADLYDQTLLSVKRVGYDKRLSPKKHRSPKKSNKSPRKKERREQACEVCAKMAYQDASNAGPCSRVACRDAVAAHQEAVAREAKQKKEVQELQCQLLDQINETERAQHEVSTLQESQRQLQDEINICNQLLKGLEAKNYQYRDQAKRDTQQIEALKGDTLFPVALLVLCFFFSFSLACLVSSSCLDTAIHRS